MNSRSTWTLVAIAAVLFALISFYEKLLRRNEPIGPERVLPHVNAADVTSVQIRPAGQLEIRADRTNGSWQLTKPIICPAEMVFIENLLQALAQLNAQTRIKAEEVRARPQGDKEFGFENPQFSLILQQGADRRQLYVGGRTAFGDEVFLQVVGVEGIYVVDANLLRLLPRQADDWRDTTLAHLRGASFDRVTVAHGANVFELQRETTNTPWRLTQPGKTRADNPKIEAQLRALLTLRATRFVPEDPKPDLEALGLQPPEFELSLAQGTNDLWRIQCGKSPTNDPAHVYARVTGQNAIALVAREPLQPWRVKYDEFRERHLVTLASRSVDVIECRGAENFTLQRQSNDAWRVVGPENFPADSVLVRNLLGALSGMEIVQFVRDTATEVDWPNYGLAPPARQYVLKAAVASGGDGTNTIIAQLDFGAPQPDKVFARHSDENSIDKNSVFAVKPADFERLPSAGWQLRDRRIWTFKENDVTKFTIRRRGIACELLHAGTNRWSIAPGSQGIVKGDTLEDTVRLLGELTAWCWTDRGEQNRARYGFDENSLQLSLEVKRGDKVETLAVEFGGIAPSQFPYAAAVLDGQTWIFEFPLTLFHLIPMAVGVPAPSPSPSPSPSP